MKYILKKLYFLVISLAFISPVYASLQNNGIDASINMSVSKDTVWPNQTVMVIISSVNANNNIASADINITFDESKFTYISYNSIFARAGDADANKVGNQVRFSYSDSKGGERAMPSGVIATFTFKTNNVASDTAATFSYTVSGVLDKNADYYNLSGTSGTMPITIHVPSTNNNLSSLSLSSGNLSPVFNPNTTNYTATVNSDTVTINGEVQDSASTVSGLGLKELVYGENIFNITVKSESGTEKIYKLTIDRPDNRSSDATLKSLTVSNTSIKFDGKDSYTATVENKVSEVIIDAIANSSKATIANTGTHKLNVGNNNIKLVVTSEKGTTKTYTINITRKEAPKQNDTKKEESNTKLEESKEENKNKSSNNYLKTLTISNINFTFDKNKTNYTIDVDSNIKTVEFKYTTEDEKAKVLFDGNKILKDGKNTFTITVTSEAGTNRKYTVILNRKNEESSSKIESSESEESKEEITNEKSLDRNTVIKVLIVVVVIMFGVTTGLILIKFKK